MTESTTTAVRRNVTKLQKAIIDGLEDVKAQDIQVFDTEHLTSLFERVIVASGTSNRQTKALAASVRDAVREAGFEKPRIEGEDNGEWIIVDCGVAVVHIMQPSIRQYYHLEELWGEKPVKSRAARAPKPASTSRRGSGTPTSDGDLPARAAPRKRAVKPTEAQAAVRAKAPAATKGARPRSAGTTQPALKAPAPPKKRAASRAGATRAARKTGSDKA